MESHERPLRLDAKVTEVEDIIDTLSGEDALTAVTCWGQATRLAWTWRDAAENTDIAERFGLAYATHAALFLAKRTHNRLTIADAYIRWIATGTIDNQVDLTGGD